MMLLIAIFRIPVCFGLLSRIYDLVGESDFVVLIFMNLGMFEELVRRLMKEMKNFWSIKQYLIHLNLLFHLGM